MVRDLETTRACLFCSMKIVFNFTNRLLEVHPRECFSLLRIYEMKRLVPPIWIEHLGIAMHDTVFRYRALPIAVQFPARPIG